MTANLLTEELGHDVGVRNIADKVAVGVGGRLWECAVVLGDALQAIGAEKGPRGVDDPSSCGGDVVEENPNYEDTDRHKEGVDVGINNSGGVDDGGVSRFRSSWRGLSGRLSYSVQNR